MRYLKKILRLKILRFKTDSVLYIAFIAQVVLWNSTWHYKPEMGIVPLVPSKVSVKASALGDEQCYFRILAFQLQNAGDSFGRFTALKEYDYRKLYQWFTLLDTLDMRSNYIPALAGYYYSQTQHIPDVKYVIDYLEQHAEKDMYHKWWWMAQAVYLANHKLQDQGRALALAYKLAATPRDDIPLWVKQMPAFIHEERGETGEALVIIKDILTHQEKFSQGEINFMFYFVQDRLKKAVEEYPELKMLLEQQNMSSSSTQQKAP